MRSIDMPNIMNKCKCYSICIMALQPKWDARPPAARHFAFFLLGSKFTKYREAYSHDMNSYAKSNVLQYIL